MNMFIYIATYLTEIIAAYVRGFDCITFNIALYSIDVDCRL